MSYNWRWFDNLTWIHKDTGTKRDPRGFDRYWNHKDTWTQQNLTWETRDYKIWDKWFNYQKNNYDIVNHKLLKDNKQRVRERLRLASQRNDDKIHLMLADARLKNKNKWAVNTVWVRDKIMELKRNNVPTFTLSNNEIECPECHWTWKVERWDWTSNYWVRRTRLNTCPTCLWVWKVKKN